MANVRSVWKFYWHPHTYPIKPKIFFDPAETQEISGKYRFGKGYAVRLPLTRYAIVIGVWKEAFDERIALTRAINGRGIKEDEFDWDTIRQGEDFENFEDIQ